MCDPRIGFAITFFTILLGASGHAQSPQRRTATQPPNTGNGALVGNWEGNYSWGKTSTNAGKVYRAALSLEERNGEIQGRIIAGDPDGDYFAQTISGALNDDGTFSLFLAANTFVSAASQGKTLSVAPKRYSGKLLPGARSMEGLIEGDANNPFHFNRVISIAEFTDGLAHYQTSLTSDGATTLTAMAGTFQAERTWQRCVDGTLGRDRGNGKYAPEFGCIDIHLVDTLTLAAANGHLKGRRTIAYTDTLSDNQRYPCFLVWDQAPNGGYSLMDDCEVSFSGSEVYEVDFDHAGRDYVSGTDRRLGCSIDCSDLALKLNLGFISRDNAETPADVFDYFLKVDQGKFIQDCPKCSDPFKSEIFVRTQ